MRYLMVVCTLGVSFGAHAHPVGLAADSCYFDRKSGGRHCHGKERSPPPPITLRGSITYPNRAAARETGAFPVRVGQPGYGRYPDRDGDGKGCE